MTEENDGIDMIHYSIDKADHEDDYLTVDF